MARAYLQCTEPDCEKKQEESHRGNRCDYCNGLLEVKYDFDPALPEQLRLLWQQRRSNCDPIDRSGVWRFRELLPFLSPAGTVVSLGEGSTPLLQTERAAEWAGLTNLSVKHQGKNPTGSFKDTGMTACITQAVLENAEVVACASTGNTSSSMAAYAARAKVKALLFVPYKGISTAKLAQAMDFGAFVVEAGENFDQAFQLLNMVASEMELYVVNSVNPYRIEGQKTVAAELMEQLNWRVPDYIVVPGGNLGNVSAIGKGLLELKLLGLIDAIPHLAVVQAAGASPFYRMLATNARELIAVQEPRTRATAIRIGNPANWKKALRVLKWSCGFCECVTDDEIEEGKAALAKDGIGCEPASAATIAGVRKLRQAGKIAREADVVAILTGHQLKDTDYIMEHQPETEDSFRRIHVEPTLEAARRVLRPWVAAARK